MSPATLIRPGLALLIGATCGILAYSLTLPLPWMLGPMIGVTLAALVQAPIEGPNRLRPIVIPVIGVMLGSGVTTDTLAQLGNWSATLAVLPLFLAGAAGVSYLTYRRLGGYDPVTAFYCAMPGGINEMLLLGEAAGGNPKQIALAHAARVLFVIFFVAFFFWLLLGVRSGAGQGNWLALDALSLADYVILAACAALGVPLAKALRLPAAPIFGPLILSGVTHLLGWVTLPPPTLLIIMAQIVMGTVIGARFIGASPSEILRDLKLAIPASLGMLLVAFLSAEAISLLSGMPLSQTFLAVSPGGLTEMSLLTLSLDQDVAFVSIMHIIRITLVIAVAPYAFAAIRRWITR